MNLSKNPKKLIMVLFLILLTSTKSFSQKTILDNSDTLICFSVPQSKFMLKEYYRAISNDSLLKVSERQIISYKKIIEADKLIFDKYDEEVANYMLIINNQQVQMQDLSYQIREHKKTIKKEKLKKQLAIGCGVLATGIMTYLWIVK